MSTAKKEPEAKAPAAVAKKEPEAKAPAAVSSSARFVYTGNGESDKESVTCFGFAFIKDGEAVEVSDPKVIAKLRGNSHFKAV